MSIGDYLLIIPAAIMSLLVLVGLIYFPFNFGRGSDDGKGSKYNPKETPDATFVRGTKGFLIFLAAYIICVFLLAQAAGNEDTTYIFTKFAIVTPLIIIAPIAISYLFGVYTAYLAAKKRTEKGVLKND